MTFVMNTPSLQDREEIKSHFEEYYRYLRNSRDKMPSSAFEYAVATWHYDANDHRCPHDSWLETLEIVELSSGERSEIRRVDIRMSLLGAYHDGYINLTHKNVTSYCLEKVHGATPGTSAPAGHQDWLIDELRLSDRGKVVHEILFSGNSHWIIECEDVIYQWIPLDASKSMERE